MNGNIFTKKDIYALTTRKAIQAHLDQKGIKYERVKARMQYAHELEKLQIELLKLQKMILKENKRVVIVFEGRDAAGKGGSIRRFMRYLNPRSAKVVALSKPTDVERGQWYFRRHVKQLPNMGEIVFFDRSWYNRAVVEPVNGFCTPEEYKLFIQQVPEFEHMLYEDGVTLIKLWFSISKEEQAKRFESRKTNPLKQWKLSPIDLKSQQLWEDYAHYIREMFAKTHTNYSPWTIIETDTKRTARLESIRYVLSQFDYPDKGNGGINLYPDPNIVKRFHRQMFDQL